MLSRLGLRLQPQAEFSKTPAEPAAGKKGPFSSFDNFTETLTTLFPVWVGGYACPPPLAKSSVSAAASQRGPVQVCLAAIFGITKPESLAWFKPDMFTVSLGFLMLSMGLTLTIDNFREVSLPVQG